MVMHLDVYKSDGWWYAELREHGEVIVRQAFYTWAYALSYGLQWLR